MAQRSWRYLAQPSITRYDREEMRQQMMRVEEKLRIAIQNVAAKDKAARTVESDHSNFVARSQASSRKAISPAMQERPARERAAACMSGTSLTAAGTSGE